MTRDSILVAGIGNIFLGDDAFGVEVVRRLAARSLPSDVRVQDFGIRGFDLAFALDSANTIVLVDAVSRGHKPGTLYTIELDLENAEIDVPPDAHSMGPEQVLRLAKQMNIQPGRILLVGCEPETFGPENEGKMGLSPSVGAAVDAALDLIEEMIERLQEGEAAAVANATV
jgi:hydrogenase maturation protease